MTQYLLDTSVVSLPMRPAASEVLCQRLNRIDAVSAISSVTLSELRFGALRLSEGSRRRRLLDYLDTLVSSEMPVLAFDRSAAEWHAAERARLETLGKTPPFADGQIAAVAASQG